MQLSKRFGRMAAVTVAGTLVVGGGFAFADSHLTEDPELGEEEVVDCPDELECETGEEGEEGACEETEADPTCDEVVEDEVIEDEVIEDEVIEDEGEGAEEEVVETSTHPENHGKLVSETAHATPSGPGKGQIVSDAARSKQSEGTVSEEEAETTGDEVDEVDDEVEVEAEAESAPSHPGRGQANGHRK